MFKKLLAFIFLCVCAVFLFLFENTPKEQLPFLPFDVSMSKPNANFAKCLEGNKNQHHQWALVKKLYSEYCSRSSSQSPRIPKIIHQIWLGGTLPEKYASFQKTFKEKHPDWEYRLWTDNDVLSFPFVNRKRFEEATNYGEKSDIWRYEILFRFGGLYADTDFECLQPFDIFHHTCDFYAGAEPAMRNNSVVSINNALFGSVAGHPILQYCIDRIAKSSPGKTPSETLGSTGPGCFKRAFLKCCRKGNYINVAFPCSYFYPIPIDSDPSLSWSQSETYGIHHNARSWIK